MNRSLRGWITAIGLVLGLFAASVATRVVADDAPAKPAAEAAKPTADAAKPDGKPAEKPADAKPAGEQPASEAPAAEKPAGDKPAAEAPKAETPKAEAAKEDAHHDEKPAAPKKADAAHDAEHHDAGHDGHHHDPTDLSHANDGPGHSNVAPRSLTGIKELKADLAIYTFLVFLLLFGILLKFGWKPIMSGLDKREQSIRDLIAQTERNAAQAEASLKANQAKLAAAADEAREMLTQARREAEQARETILAEARAAAQKERDRAVEDIASAKNVALREIAQTSVNTAVSLASRILQREVKATDHSQLIQEALEQFPSRN